MTCLVLLGKDSVRKKLLWTVKLNFVEKNSSMHYPVKRHVMYQEL